MWEWVGRAIVASGARQLGKAEIVTDANGAPTRTEFDVFGRALKIFAPGEASSSNPTAQYDYFMGNTGVPSRVHVQVRSDLGGTNPATYQHAWWLFDGRGRLIQKQAQGLNGQTLLANTRYNNLGQAYRASNPYAISGYDPINTPQYQTPDWNQPYTQNTFDPIGRVTRTDSPGIPAPTLMTYNHQWMTVTDANGHTKDSFTDGFGRVTQVVEHNLGATYTTNYGYDTLDRLMDTWDNANNNTHLTYDWLGRKTTMQDPDMGSWGYEYDNAGNLKRQSDARGNSLCFLYDELNRLTEKKARQATANCAGGTVAYMVNYFYDDTTNGNKGIGRRTSMTDPTGNTQFVYDLIGRVMTTTQTIDTSSYTTIVTSDAMGRARSTKYPDNEIVNQTYNAQGLPQTLINADALPFTYIAGANYNAASQMTTLTFGNNVVTTYGYNSQNLRLLTLQTGAGNSIQNLSYGYDNVGNVTNLTDILNNKTSNYTYDDLNRLTNWELVATYSQSWQYNPIGNLTQRVDISTPQNFEYTDPAHKHAVTKHNGVTQFVYDANGNMIQRYSDLMQYDVENRLTSTTSGSTTTSNYYNGDGARVKKVITTGGASVTTHYIGGIYEYTTWTGGTSIAKYYYFGGQRVAVKNSSGVSYLHGDHLGSTSATSGAVTSSQTFYPFGAIFSSSGTPPTDYGFTGQKQDASAGLMYYGARYYDPGLGRFTQPDTIVPNAMDPQSLNRYSYVSNNPVNFVDPTGHSAEGSECQSWDTWCWENQYWTALGWCYNNNGSEQWNRPCDPDIANEGRADELTLGILAGDQIPRSSFLTLARLEQFYLRIGKTASAIVISALIAAYAAVGEINENCGLATKNPQCAFAFGAVILTIKNRYNCLTDPALKCDLRNSWNSFAETYGFETTYGTLALGGCESTRGCDEYAGISRWMTGCQIGCLSWNGPNATDRLWVSSQMQVAFAVALSIFSGDYKNDLNLKALDDQVGKRVNFRAQNCAGLPNCQADPISGHYFWGGP